MKITQILSNLTNPKAAAKSAANDPVIAEQLADMGAQIQGLKADVKKLEKLDAENVAVGANLAAIKNQTAQITAFLKQSCEDMRIEIQETATNFEMISKMQMSVASTLSKLGVNLNASHTVGSNVASSNTKTLEEWRALNPTEAAAFFEAGGKLVDA